MKTKKLGFHDPDALCAIEPSCFSLYNGYTMEQHPVPQNVTTFQFRLVGDMTIRQFGYLAGGIIGGYLCYKLPLPFFFTWPLAITSGLLGFGLAFVPVEERPMDVWIASFFRNVYSPTQWVWQKEKRVQPLKPAAPALVVSAPIPTPPPRPTAQKPPASPVDRQPAPHPPTNVPPAPRAAPIIYHKTSVVEWFRSFFRNKPRQKTQSLSPGFSFADALTTQQAPSKPSPQPPLVKSQAATQATQPTTPPAARPAPHERVVELQGQLSEALRERERMEKELIAIRQHLEQQAKPAQQAPLRQASTIPSSPTTTTTSVRVISPGGAVNAGLPRLTTFPNVVTGIVKDQYGNLMAGMLVTVRDKDDTPLRALKTNKLGQFAASTPLPNNTYVIEIEDPRGGFIFDKAQVSLVGTVAPPIEVTAKSQKQVERDKLAKEIFGQNQM